VAEKRRRRALAYAGVEGSQYVCVTKRSNPRRPSVWYRTRPSSAERHAGAEERRGRPRMGGGIGELAGVRNNGAVWRLARRNVDMNILHAIMAGEAKE